MDEMYETAKQTKYRFLGSMKYSILVMDEMCKIGWFIANFEC